MLTQEDFVMNTHKDGTMVGGYLLTDLGSSFHNILVQHTENNIQKGGNPSAVLEGLKNMAVPLGLLYLQQTTEKPVSESIQIMKNVTNKVIDDSLYDKLVDLVSHKKTKSSQKTRKNKKTNKNKTRKQ